METERGLWSGFCVHHLPTQDRVRGAFPQPQKIEAHGGQENQRESRKFMEAGQTNRGQKKKQEFRGFCVTVVVGANL